jgi:trehalose 6-phosphate phosphatase
MRQIPTQIYLLGEAGLASLNAFIDTSTLFAFDLDGTLAPIVDDPEGIEVPPAVERELTSLKKLASIAVITGRSLNDAQKHLGIIPHYLVGNHGAEGLPGWEERLVEFKRLVSEWERQLRIMFSASTSMGIIIENKGASISIHYRSAPFREAARTVLVRAIDQLDPQPRLVHGKYVANLLPAAAPDKGKAMLELMHREGHTKGMFVGDDATDEDVFRITEENLLTVHIGDGRKSRAHYFLKDQREILQLLRKVTAVLMQIKTGS